MKINLGLLWTMLTSTVLAVVYMFSTFASAADVERIEYQILKQSIRAIRSELTRRPNDPDLVADLKDAIDALCIIEPKDRECKTNQ